MFRTCLASLVLILLPSVAAGAIWWVDDDNTSGPWDGSRANPWQNIQDAVASPSVSDGDTILVLPGYYPRSRAGANIVLDSNSGGKNLVIRSDQDGSELSIDPRPEETIIDAEGQGSAVSILNGNESVLEGFTVTGGTGTDVNTGRYCGGGIFIRYGSRPTIRGNIITGNAVDYDGAGIYIGYDSVPLITGNVIKDNECVWEGHASGGGGIVMVSCLAADAIRIENNLFLRNQAFNGGEGGGFSCWNCSNVILSNNTFSGNVVDNLGGAIQVVSSNVVALNNIMWGDDAAGQGLEIAVRKTPDAPDPSLTLSYSDIDSRPGAIWEEVSGYITYGPGLIYIDPLFVNASNSDFHLQWDSPCVDAGDPAVDPCCDRDVYGNPRVLDGLLDLERRIDMGAHEFNNVHLEVVGDATPGGTLIIDTSGTFGLPVMLFVGTSAGEFCHQRFGCLFLDLSSPWSVFPWGTTPSHVVATIPSWAPTPLPLVLQELALAGQAGNMSNSVELVIQ